MALVLAAAPLAGQDPFVIAVYPVATADPGEWEVETYLNYTARGTTTFDESVAPTEHQTHLTFEVTRGIAANWDASLFVLTAHRPGVGAETAGWRLRTAVRAPARWALPLDVGFSAEVEWSGTAYGSGSPSLELTPIFERHVGGLGLGLNLNFDRALGPGGEGWELEPSALVSYRLSAVIIAKVEYFGTIGELKAPLPASAQVHQFFPGVELHPAEAVAVGLSVGAGATTAGNRLVLASRIEVEF